MQLPKELKYTYIYDGDTGKWIPLTKDQLEQSGDFGTTEAVEDVNIAIVAQRLTLSELLESVLEQLKIMNLHLMVLTDEKFNEGDLEI
jgi:hypothetical protein